MLWTKISLGDHTNLHVLHGGNLTGVRYRDNILDAYVRPYAAVIGNDFILMDNNTRSHRDVLGEDYIESQDLKQMEWPAQFRDINPIEHTWDYLGRQVTVLTL